MAHRLSKWSSLLASSSLIKGCIDTLAKFSDFRANASNPGQPQALYTRLMKAQSQGSYSRRSQDWSIPSQSMSGMLHHEFKKFDFFCLRENILKLVNLSGKTIQMSKLQEKE